MPKQKKQKVLVALSGGIDSAVSAYLLLKQGYLVEAAFMKNWSSTQGLKIHACPWLQDRQEALRVAAFLRIPLHTLDFEKQYEALVLEYFFTEYQAGRTPNPDVMCNKEIKFKLLYNWALGHGFDYLATGHYARIEPLAYSVKRKRKNNQNSTLPALGYTLVRSADEFKDQTYFIYNIKAEQLPHILFPIGRFKKDQVRQLARKIGLPNAERKESMGLCFVGKIRLKEFLDQKVTKTPGRIVDTAGKVLGSHQGLEAYTLGQRQGIQIGAFGPYYVAEKQLATQTLVVTKNPEDPLLQRKTIVLHSVHFLNKLSHFPFACNVRFRHQQPLRKAVIKIVDKARSEYEVIFKETQAAIASGQSIVFYKNKVCLGGGVVV